MNDVLTSCVALKFGQGSIVKQKMVKLGDTLLVRIQAAKPRLGNYKWF